MTQPTRAPAVTPAPATGANEATTGASAAASGAQRGWSVYAVYSLGFLTLISAFNYLDRGILGLALPLIKHEMRVSDTALGLASGLAFALFYSLLGVPIAWLADRWSRRNIIAIGFGFWSVMTALTGFVGNIWQLAGARFLMGAGEACGVAPSNALVCDLFPTSRRAMALAILASASSLAYIVFYPLLGWIGQHHGWRAMFMASGVPGLALTLLFVLTVREPPKGAPGSKRPGLEPASLPASVRFLFGSPAYLLLLLGASLMGASAYAGGTWNPTFLARVHHMRLGEIAAALGPIQGVCGGAGILLGGYLTDALGRRDERWRLRLPAIACLLAAPTEALFLLGGSRFAWMTGFALTSFFMLAHQAPIFAATMSVSKARMRAVAISLMLLVAGLLGQIAGPLLVGALDDSLQPVLGPTAVRYSLLLVSGCAACAALCFWSACRYFEQSKLRARE